MRLINYTCVYLHRNMAASHPAHTVHTKKGEKVAKIKKNTTN